MNWNELQEQTSQGIVELGDGFKLTDTSSGMTVSTPLGREFPVVVEQTGRVELSQDGYDNGVNCHNRVGRADELIEGWFSSDGHIVDDRSVRDPDAGLISRHGGHTGVYNYSRQETFVLTPNTWALCLVGRVDGRRDERDFVLFVG